MTLMRPLGFIASLTLCVTSALAATPSAPGQTKATYGDFGLDLTGLDKSVKPGDDFYHYADGNWLKTNTIPSDRARWGVMDQLSEDADERIRKLIQSLPAHAPAGSVEQKVSDYYHAFLNQNAIDAAGLKPAQPALDAIAAARTDRDIATLMGRPDLQLKAPIDFGVSIDSKNPDRYLTIIAQGGLGLPDRDFYLKDEPKFQEIRTQYKAHLEKMLTLAGIGDGANKAAQILDVETKLAEAHWPRAKLRDRDLTYNIRTLAQLEKEAPQFPFVQLFAAGGLEDRKEYNLAHPDAVA